MRKCRAAAIAGMVSTIFAVGCSLLVDTSGLGGQVAADASSEVGSEASTTAESGADTSVGTDAGKACAATFCDDFDETPLGERWTTKSIENGGLLDLGANALSPPSALRARFGTGAPPSDRLALLEKDLGAGSHLRCDFAIFIEKRPTNAFVDVFRLRTTAPGLDHYSLQLGLAASGAELFREDLFGTDGGCLCPRKNSSPPRVPDGTWVRISIETDFSTASLSYDGTVVSAGTFGDFVPSSNLVVSIGSAAYEPQDSVVLFDDFACTLTP